MGAELPVFSEIPEQPEYLPHSTVKPVDLLFTACRAALSDISAVEIIMAYAE